MSTYSQHAQCQPELYSLAVPMTALPSTECVHVCALVCVYTDADMDVLLVDDVKQLPLFYR